MTFRRLLPIIIILALLGGVAALIFNIPGVSSNAEYDYGEYSKDIVVDENSEVTGDLADYISLVPGTYTLNYETKEDGKYGDQVFMIILKIKIKKQYPYDQLYSQKLKFLKSRGTIGKLEMELSRGSLDLTENDKFESFVKEGKEGDVKEFMFYKSLGNREYADEIFKTVHRAFFETSGFKTSSSSSSSDSESETSSSSESSSETPSTTTTESTSSTITESTATAESTTTTSSTSESTYDSSSDEDEDEDFEEDYKIDLELDEYESYIEQYKECDDKKSAKALKLYSQAKAYGLKMKAKKSKMSKAQKSRLESISSQL